MPALAIDRLWRSDLRNKFGCAEWDFTLLSTFVLLRIDRQSTTFVPWFHKEGRLGDILAERYAQRLSLIGVNLSVILGLETATCANGEFTRLG